MIIDQIDTFLNISNTFKVSAFLSKRKFDSNGSIEIEDSKLQDGRFQVNAKGVFTRNPRHTFKTGTWLDLIVYEKNINYLEAIRWVIPKCDLTNKSQYLLLERPQIEVSLMFMGHRIILDRLILGQNNLLKNEDAYKVRNLVSINSKPQYAKNSVWALNGAELNGINTVIIQFFKPDPLPKISFKNDEVYMCIPYFINHHLISCIEVFSLKKEVKHINTITVIPSNAGFSSLWDVDLSNKKWNLLPNIESLLALKETTEDHCSNTAATTCKILSNDNHHTLYTKPDAVYFSDDVTPIEEVLSFSEYFKTFNIADLKDYFAEDINYEDVTTKIKNKFREMVITDKYYSERMDALLSGVKDDEDLLLELMLMCKANKWTTFETIIASYFVSNLILETSKYKAYKDATCYLVVDKKTRKDIAITNFRLKLLNKIVYPRSGKSYFQLTLLFKDKEYPLVLDMPTMTNSQKLITTLQQTVTECLRPGQIVYELPELKDITYKRLIGKIIEAECCKVSSVIGSEFLGGSYESKTYYTTIHQIDEVSRIKNYNFISNRDQDLLHGYFLNNTPFENTDEVLECREKAVFGLLSLFARTFVTGDVVNLHFSKVQEKNWLALLKYFGQTRVVGAGRRHKIDTDQILNYPVVSYVPINTAAIILDAPDDNVLEFSSLTDCVDGGYILYKLLTISILTLLCGGDNSVYMLKMFAHRTTTAMTWEQFVAEGENIAKLFHFINCVTPRK